MQTRETTRIRLSLTLAAGLVLSLLGASVPAQDPSALDRIIFVNGQLLDDYYPDAVREAIVGSVVR
jgi:hypothetical protein